MKIKYLLANELEPREVEFEYGFSVRMSESGAVVVMDEDGDVVGGLRGIAEFVVIDEED
jgi:hypothetical protein